MARLTDTPLYRGEGEPRSVEELVSAIESSKSPKPITGYCPNHKGQGPRVLVIWITGIGPLVSVVLRGIAATPQLERIRSKVDAGKLPQEDRLATWSLAAAPDPVLATCWSCHGRFTVDLAEIKRAIRRGVAPTMTLM